MVKGKLLRFFVSCMVVVLVIFPAAALASSGMQDGLQLILTTDKVSYSKNETITINAAVKNTNSFDIADVKLDIRVPTGLSYKTTSPTGSIDLTAGQTADLSAEAVLNSTPDDMPQTGDYAPVELLLLLVLLSAGALAWLLILKRKNRASFLSILLCITLMSSSCFLIPSPAYALPAAKSFTVMLPVTVDGDSYTLQATLTYTPPAPNPPALYAVTVNNGTGDGNYAPGATVSITADTPAPGYSFAGWTVVSGGVTLESTSSAATTFTMPASAVEVTATYALNPYAVTVNNGTGDGNYAPGATVTITADTPAPGYAFTGWTVVTGGVTLASSSSAVTTFTMPEGPVEVTATYALNHYAVTVNNGTGGGNYAPGATVTITADAPDPGYAFTGWTVVSGGVTLASSSSAATTFTMPASPVEVTATYALNPYAVTVNNGTGDGIYAPGTTVTITADAPAPGYAFTGWTVVSGGVTLASSSSETTTFTMPASPVEVTATYALTTYAVTVNNGTGGGNYAPGTTVTITADTPAPGYAFTGWTVVSGGVTLASASSAVTTFTMPANPVEVTATYALITYAVTVNNGTGDGNFAPGATVTITADTPDPGYAFTGWTVVSGGVTLDSALSAATTFTMPASPVEVTATYALNPYAVTVNNGTGDGDYTPGDTVTITADAPDSGYAFAGWTVVSGGVTLNSALSAATTFTMPASAVEVTATYALNPYAVTVNNGTGDGDYTPGDTVTITADAPDSGYAFAGWTVVSGGVTLASASSAVTTFTMPANPVEVTATYALTSYTVTVNNGTGDGDYTPGDTVTITADAPDSGYAFAGWTVVSGGVTLNSALSAATTFTMPASPVEVTATYAMPLDFSSGGNMTMATVLGGLLNQGAIIGKNGATDATGYNSSPMNLSGNTDALAQVQTIPENMILTGWNATFTMQNTLALIGTSINVYADIYIAPSGSDNFTRAGTLTLTPSFTGIVTIGSMASGTVSGHNIPVSAGDRVILVCRCEVIAGLDTVATFTGTVTAQATLKK